MENKKETIFDKIKIWGGALLAVLGTIFTFILIFRKKPAVLEVDKVLEDQQSDIQSNIDILKDEIADIEENGVPDLSDSDVEDYWNK